MRVKLINFLKTHPKLLDCLWNLARFFFQTVGRLFPVNKNRIIFCSFGGRKYDDSPKAIYEEILGRSEFDDWDLVWAFVAPDEFEIPRGRKIKIDTISFFHTLITSRVWVSNSGMDRGIEFNKKGIIKVETWHGCPLKKIGGEENTGSMAINHKKYKIDHETIRCAQSEFDLEIFSRVFHADKKCFLSCDLPRNDVLKKGVDVIKQKEIKDKIGIPDDKKVLLYMPTYREYNIDDDFNMYIKPPINFEKWKKLLSDKYILLVRAHYAITKELNINNDGFVYDVSKYKSVNELYLVSDILISDYSSSYFDFSILERPMLCFAYDLEEYSTKRGLYLDLKEVLPCPIDRTEDELINHIVDMEEMDYINKTKKFHEKYSPYAGEASKKVCDAIIYRLQIDK